MATDTKTLDEQKHLIYDIAEATAPTWEQRRADVEEVATPVREWMLRELRPQDGDTVLELAAGVARPGSRRLRSWARAGRLITSDFSPAMLEAARRRGAELGVANADYRIIDGERIELDDDSVDGVLCRFGYMLMPDSAAAFAETRRMLRPGGRPARGLGRTGTKPFFAIIGITLVERGTSRRPDPAGTEAVQHASPERLDGLLRDAGFAEVRIEEVHGRFVIPDVDEYLSVIADTAGPIGLALREPGRARPCPGLGRRGGLLAALRDRGWLRALRRSTCAVAS